MGSDGSRTPIARPSTASSGAQPSRRPCLCELRPVAAVDAHLDHARGKLHRTVPPTGSSPARVTESWSARVGGTRTTCVSRQPRAGGSERAQRRVRGRVESPVRSASPPHRHLDVGDPRARRTPARPGDDQHLDRADLRPREAHVDSLAFAGRRLPSGRKVIVGHEAAATVEDRRRSARCPRHRPGRPAGRRWRCRRTDRRSWPSRPARSGGRRRRRSRGAARSPRPATPTPATRRSSYRGGRAASAAPRRSSARARDREVAGRAHELPQVQLSVGGHDPDLGDPDSSQSPPATRAMRSSIALTSAVLDPRALAFVRALPRSAVASGSRAVLGACDHIHRLQSRGSLGVGQHRDRADRLTGARSSTVTDSPVGVAGPRSIQAVRSTRSKAFAGREATS